MQNKNNLWLFYIINLVFIYINIIGSIKTFQKVGLDPSHQILFSQKDNQVFVYSVIADDLKSVFKKGDLLEKVNGIKISSKDDLEFVFDRMDLGQNVSLNLNRAGSSIVETLQVPKYYTEVNIVIRLFVAFVFLVAAIYVYLKNPGDLVVTLWYFVALFASAIISNTWGKYNLNHFDIGQLSRLAFLIVYAFIPNVLIHLAFVFPVPSKSVYRKYLFLLYILSFIWAVYLCYLFMSSVYSDSLEIFHRFMFAFNVNRLYFAGGIILSIVNLVYSYKKAEDDIDRRKLLWLIFGISFGPILYAVFHQIPQSFGFNSLIPLEVITFAMLSIPVTFTIAVIRYNLFDIDAIVQQSTLYFIVISFLFMLYAGLVGFAFLFIGELDFKATLASAIIAAILIPFILEPIRNYLKKNIDKLFFKKRYYYRKAIEAFAKNLINSFDEKSTIILLFERIDNILSPDSMAMYLLDHDSSRMEYRNGVNFSKPDSESLFYLEEIAENAEYRIISRLQSLDHHPSYFYLNEDFINKNPGICLIVTMRTKTGELDGLLILGSKKSNTKYTAEDIFLLTSLISNVEQEIDRIRLQHKLIEKSIEAKHLQDLNKAKSFFVSSVSHDLQTPLTSIKMFSELLREKKDLSVEKREEYITVIENESERLSRLIKNVLDLSQIERRVKRYDFRDVELNVMVNKVVKLMQYPLEQNGFLFKLNLVPEILPIRADEDAIISCIVNLISNAMKYSAENKEIEISTSFNQNYAMLTISDKGVGIPVSDQDKIFDTFYRSPNQQVQNVAGVGLGLTITSHVINAHKGKITLKSEPNSGSIFTLSFPFVKGAL
jgi:signal transduction histidine kinase